MIEEIISFHEKKGFFSQTIPSKNLKKSDKIESEIELTEENLCIKPKKGTPKTLKMHMIVSVSSRNDIDYNYTELILSEEKIYIFFGKKKYDLKKSLYFYKAMKKWMQLPKRLYYLGNKEAKLGNFNGAIDFFERALKLQPKYLDVLNAKGKVHENLGEIKNAILCYEAAYKIEPTNKKHLMNLDRIKAEIKKGGAKYEGLEKELEALRCPNCKGPIDKVPTPGASIECVWCGFKIGLKDS